MIKYREDFTLTPDYNSVTLRKDGSVINLTAQDCKDLWRDLSQYGTVQELSLSNSIFVKCYMNNSPVQGPWKKFHEEYEKRVKVSGSVDIRGLEITAHREEAKTSHSNIMFTVIRSGKPYKITGPLFASLATIKGYCEQGDVTVVGIHHR